jgi:hypothetical protein
VQLLKCLLRLRPTTDGAGGEGVVDVGTDGRGRESWWQRVLPLTATVARLGPPKRCRAPPQGRPRCASPTTTRLRRRYARSFDPMLEELLAAAFVMSCSVEPPQGFVEPPPATVVLSPQPSAQELTQLTPPQVGHPDAEFGDVATPRGSWSRLRWRLSFHLSRRRRS